MSYPINVDGSPTTQGKRVSGAAEEAGLFRRHEESNAGDGGSACGISEGKQRNEWAWTSLQHTILNANADVRRLLWSRVGGLGWGWPLVGRCTIVPNTACAWLINDLFDVGCD